MESNEVEISVPWGQISCKTWGTPNNCPILLVHNLLDNAASFDQLIPQLPKNYYVCLDLPGHGKSSHLPNPSVYHIVDFLISIKIVAGHFCKKRKIVLIGHGMGATISIIYQIVYPEFVDKLVLLDEIFGSNITSTQLKSILLKHHEKYFESFKKSSYFEYVNYNQLKDAFLSNSTRNLNDDAMKSLLARSVREVPNTNPRKFIVTTDERIKNTLGITFDMDFIVDLLKKQPVFCPVLIVVSTKRPQHVWNGEKQVIKMLKRRKNAKVVFMLGAGHHVHLNDPEKVAQHLHSFLETQNATLSKL